jgi:hypothetical protein
MLASFDAAISKEFIFCEIIINGKLTLLYAM